RDMPAPGRARSPAARKTSSNSPRAPVSGWSAVEPLPAEWGRPTRPHTVSTLPLYARPLSPVGAERSTGAGRPGHAGIGLRARHHRELLEKRPAIEWVEVHSENYLARDGAQRKCLERIRPHYALSLHGVGLSLGSTDPLQLEHLQQLAGLIQDLEPLFLSEHMSWSSVGGRFANDLLPLPYTEEALHHMVARVSQVQEFLKRQILVE